MEKFTQNNKIGLYIGRFQPFHLGHRYVIQEALRQCDHLIIAIGSAQESRTAKNPFSVYERMEFIYNSLKVEFPISYLRCSIIPILDREEKSDDSSWGEYLIKEVYRQTKKLPDICFTGEEQIRQHWFDTVDIEEVAIDRSDIPVSATMVRAAARSYNESLFRQLVPRPMRQYWRKICEVINNVGEDT
jgi:nicotinamide-nucleotide adenylyltransferase